jgi:flagellar hook-length control protein FliK
MAVTEVGDAPTEDDRPDSSSLNSELASQSSADELDVTINATDVDTAVERTEGAALETRSGDTRTNPAISQDRATVSSQQVGAKSTLDESQSPQVDPSRFVSRVSRAFEAANSRGGAVQLRLSPPELGAMRVELSVQQGVLSAHLETETAAAKSLLIDNLPALRERLAAMDIRVERFDVDVRQDSTGGQPDWQAQQDSRNHHREHTEAVRGRGHQSTPRESLTEVARPSSPYDATGRFNAIA